MRVFVTGSSSCLAQSLLPQLCARADVEVVTGIDLKPARFSHPKYRHSILSILSPDLRRAMAGNTAVIHLAYAVMKGDFSDDELRENNVSGTVNVFQTATALGISKIVNMSSVSVYGQGQELNESAPLQPADVFLYAQHKAEIERLSAKQFPNVVHLRSHLIFGRHAQPFLIDMANAPVYVSPSSRPWPVLQVVHEADVANAICLALDHDVTGPFNVASPEVVSLPDLIKYRRAKVFPIPLAAIKALFWVSGLFGRRDESTWLEVINTSLTVSCTRAMEELGWRPRHSAWEARAEMSKAAS